MTCTVKYTPNISSYCNKNHNQNQKLERFRGIENSRRRPKSTRKMRKDEHQDAEKKIKSQVLHGFTFFLNGNI